VKKKARLTAELAQSITSGPAADPGLVDSFRSRFSDLPADQRLQFFRWLSGELEVEKSRIEAPIAAVIAASDDEPEAWNRHVRELRRALASPRHRLFEALIDTEGGLQAVLELRAEVLEAQRAGETGLEALEEDIAHLLERWCQHGLLYLEEIDLESPYRTVRFLKERELVHPMVSLDEMGRRLGDDRMCYALYHAAMPEEPVIFIEVALSRGLLRSIHDVIGAHGGQREPVKSPDTAIFYSINNTQNGLAGLGLGQILIARVTEALRRRHPSIETLATLSPMPGFWPHYLKPILEGGDHAFCLDRAAVVELLTVKARAVICDRHRAAGGAGDDPAAALAAVLSRPDWISDLQLRRLLRKPLVDIAYTYVALEKDRSGKPINPVAGFHLGNGATVARSNVNFAANTSPRGLEESCGLMVNYLYSEGSLARIGRAVRSLLPWRRHALRPAGPPSGEKSR
jgi:hypothetical protein